MKKLKNLLLHVTLLIVIAIGTWSGPVLAGSIVLTGHDPDFHASDPNAGEITFNQRAISFVMDPAFNPFKAGGINKFLFVQSNIPVPYGHKDGLAGLAASGYTLGTDFDMASAATLNAALSQLGTTYSALVVGSDFGGLLTQAELDILNARSTDIISFLNAGGGLYAMAESNAGSGLTPGGGHFGFLPFVITSTAIGYCGPVLVTPFGTSLGFTNFDTCADHNSFNGDFGLSVVDTLPSGQIISLAGRGVTTPSGVGADTTPPSLIVPSPLTLECNRMGGILSSSPAIQAWLASATASDAVDPHPTITNDLTLGLCAVGVTKTVTWTATDTSGNSSSASSTITVVDTTAPTINSATASPSRLWSPNHQMVGVTISVNASDACAPSVSCVITNVSSNEPINGLGDGNTALDWKITGNLTVDLRAERSGAGTGRIYTITFKCTDASGNSDLKTVTVDVPHDQAR